MGNIFSNVGIDSAQSVDDTVTGLLFHPPDTDESKLKMLEKIMTLDYFF